MLKDVCSPGSPQRGCRWRAEARKNVTTMDTLQFGYCFRPDLCRDNHSGTLCLWISRYGVTRYIPTTYDDVANAFNMAVAGSCLSGVDTEKVAVANNPVPRKTMIAMRV